MSTRFFSPIGIIMLASVMLTPRPSAAIPESVARIIVLSNALSILGGIGLFSAATIDVVQEHNNQTDLLETRRQVAATSFVCFGVGAALSIVASEMCQPKLLERIDSVATAMTAFGFALVSSGIWTKNSNATLAGSVTLSSFFASRALLLPLVLEKNPESFRPSDKILLGALTIFGNAGGLLLTWANFETNSYGRQILQAGWYVIGIINPIVFAGLTINLFRLPKQVAVSAHV